MDRPGGKKRVRLQAVSTAGSIERSDELATEEPMEIRLVSGDAIRTVAVTMRTPGNDFELAAGFLHSEGVLGTASIERISYCVDADVGEEQRFNIVNVVVSGELPEMKSLERHFYTNSSCGVCGRASLEALSLSGVRPIGTGPDPISREVIASLSESLRSSQRLFNTTGGLHAAGSFTLDGDLVRVREDVGRHNAVDKLLGAALLAYELPLDSTIVMVSGRSSYEIVQKCLVSGVPVVCSVSAPSSLAVEVAERFGITLVGFLRDERFNVYTHPHRIAASAPVG